MIEVSKRLMAELVEVYPHYVRQTVVDRGWVPDDDLDRAINDGARWLEASLGDELSLAFGEQRRGPLEIFQEAMRFPTAALVAAGVPQPSRDQIAAAALPGDVYDLAPVSSRALGESVWHAHLTWGATKAAAFLREAGGSAAAGAGGDGGHDPTEDDDDAGQLES